MTDRKRLTRRQALRNSKIAVLTMLEQTCDEAMADAALCEGVEHDNCVTQALADNQLMESLARRWNLERVER